MSYPVTLGNRLLPDNKKEYYLEETHEFLVLTCDETVGYVSFRNDDGSWFHTAASIDVLGWVDLTTGRQNGERTKMEWVLTDEERNTRSYSKRFGKLKIYRVKAHPHRPFTGEKAKYNDVPKYAEQIYVTEILGELVPNAFLFGVLEEYKKPVTMHSDLLGDFVLDKRYGGSWECECDWLGRKVWFDFSDDSDEEFTVIIKNAEQFWRDREKWDREMREYAADELTYLANDWGENSADGEITEEEFARKINLCSVHFMSEGDFQAWFDDGGFFGDHSITVWGNFEKGFKNARLEG
jgi:hypothetical protein